MTWSGDAIWAIEEANAVGVDLDYEVPDEGSNIWYDGWVIPKYAKNPQAASYFINFMCRPDIALRNMDFCGYVSSMYLANLHTPFLCNLIYPTFSRMLLYSC